MSDNNYLLSPSTGVAAVVGSRRERKKERTRQEIYRAAMESFLARGFDAVTIEEICQAADVAKGTFFLHFPTKDALLLEYGHQAVQELEVLLHAHQAGAITALQKVLTALAERATHHAAMVQLLERELVSRPTAFASATEQSGDLGQLFASLISAGQEAGELRRSIDPRIAAAMLTATYFVIVGEWAKRGGKFDLAQAIRQSLDITLNGLATKKLTLRPLQPTPRRNQ